MAGYGQNGWAQNNRINWDDIPDNGPPPLEPGYYWMRIVKAEAKPTKKDGSPAVGIRLQGLETADKDPKPVASKRLIFDTLVFNGDFMFRIKQLVRSGKDLVLPETDGFEVLRNWAADLVDQEVIAQLGVRKNQSGQDENQILAYVTEDEALESNESAADGPPDRAETRASRSNEREDTHAADAAPTNGSGRTRRRGVEAVRDAPEPAQAPPPAAAAPPQESRRRRR